MRVINLARRPFVNRRPIVRVAGFLWVLGALLLVSNVYLYRSHWVNSRHEREAFAEVERQREELEAQLAGPRQEVERLNPTLQRGNRRAAFLNRLISYRTFPWSALFEDLEDVLPADVRLVNVQPNIRLAPETRPRRAASQEGRRRTAEAEPAEEPEALASDEVLLELTGYAKNPGALYALVDRLFASPFRNPFLASENFDPSQGGETVQFRLSVIYLTRRPPVEPVEPSADPEAEAAPEAAGEVAEQGGSAREPGEPVVPGGPEPGAPASGAGSVADGVAAAGRTGLPAAPSRAAPLAARPPAGGGGSPGPAAAERAARALPGFVRPGTPSPAAPPGAGTPTGSRQTAAALERSAPSPRAGEPGDDRGRRPGRDRPGRDRPGRDRPASAEDPEVGEPGVRDDDASATPALNRGSRRLYPVLPARLELDLFFPDTATIEGVAT